MAQLDYYHRLADNDETIRLVGDHKSLEEAVVSHKKKDKQSLLGIVPLMEGAEENSSDDLRA